MVRHQGLLIVWTAALTTIVSACGRPVVQPAPASCPNGALAHVTNGNNEDFEIVANGVTIGTAPPGQTDLTLPASDAPRVNFSARRPGARYTLSAYGSTDKAARNRLTYEVRCR